MRFVFVLGMLAGCTQTRSDTCKSICSHEADCIAETKAEIPFDEKECIAACSVLEQDPQNSAKVKQHGECIAKHSCEDMLKKCQ
jgi:hypothetical protein